MDENFTNSDDMFKDGEKSFENGYLNDNSALYEDFEASENFAYTDSFANQTKSEPEEKKFVITINKENIAYIEALTGDERAQLVNSLISNYRNRDLFFAKNITTKKFLKHLLVVILTLLIGFPLVFYITNASIEATANSYREVQSNFEKLYQQQGGVRRKEIQNLKY